MPIEMNHEENDPDSNEDQIAPEDLRAALVRLGIEARRRAFAAGVGIVVMKHGRLVEIHASGAETDLGNASAS